MILEMMLEWINARLHVFFKERLNFCSSWMCLFLYSILGSNVFICVLKIRWSQLSQTLQKTSFLNMFVLLQTCIYRLVGTFKIVIFLFRCLIFYIDNIAKNVWCLWKRLFFSSFLQPIHIWYIMFECQYVPRMFLMFERQYVPRMFLRFWQIWP